MNDIVDRLNSIEDPKEADALVSSIWKKFAGSQEHQLLEANLFSLAKSAETVVLNPGATSEQRAFSSGQLSVARALQETIKAAIEFDPTKAEYPEPPPADDTEDIPQQFRVV